MDKSDSWKMLEDSKHPIWAQYKIFDGLINGLMINNSG